MAIGVAPVVVGAAEVVPVIRIVRLELDGVDEVGDGLVVVALLAAGGAPAVPVGGVVRVEPDGAGKVGDGLAVLALAGVGGAPAVPVSGVVRVQAGGAGVVGDGPVVVALAEISGAPVLPVGGVVRVELDGAGAVGDDPVIIPLAEAGNGPGVPVSCAVRIEADGAGAVGDGPVVILLIAVEVAAPVPGEVGLPAVGVQVNGPVKIKPGLLVFAIRVMGFAPLAPDDAVRRRVVVAQGDGAGVAGDSQGMLPLAEVVVPLAFPIRGIGLRGRRREAGRAGVCGRRCNGRRRSGVRGRGGRRWRRRSPAGGVADEFGQGFARGYDGVCRQRRRWRCRFRGGRRRRKDALAQVGLILRHRPGRPVGGKGPQQAGSHAQHQNGVAVVIPPLVKGVVAELKKVADQAVFGVAQFLAGGQLNVMEGYPEPALGHYAEDGVGVAGPDFGDVQVVAEQAGVFPVPRIQFPAIYGRL